MLLLVDNYDSFTYNLVDYFLQLNIEVDVVKNNIEIDAIDWNKYNGIVLSPGSGVPSSAGNLMKILDEAVQLNLPLLGVCLGHQAIGEYFGAKLTKASVPMHGKTSVITHNGNGLFNGIAKKMTVVRYHSLILADNNEKIKIIATTDENEIMAIYICNRPIYGIQFHPESVLTEKGIILLSNWLRIHQISR